MKHSFRQDLQDYQDCFGLVWLYPVHPVCRGEAFLRRLVDPVRKWKVHAVKFLIRSNWPFFKSAAALTRD
jgi:hypothetical protein